MSVDHYDCDVCDANGIYEGYIATCEKCGNAICNKCISDKIIDDYIYSAYNEDGELKEEYCPFCSGDKVSDKQRIDWLIAYINKTVTNILKLDSITLEDIDEKILEERKKNKGIN